MYTAMNHGKSSSNESVTGSQRDDPVSTPVSTPVMKIRRRQRSRDTRVDAGTSSARSMSNRSANDDGDGDDDNNDNQLRRTKSCVSPNNNRRYQAIDTITQARRVMSDVSGTPIMTLQRLRNDVIGNTPAAAAAGDPNLSGI